MYRIRTAEGNETVYDSLEEFSAAVRRGAVTPDDEIFHTRAGRWLDIKSHPHYRSAITMANGAGGSPAGVGSGPAHPKGGSGPAPAPAPRPVQQTVYRHQLQPPAPKSKDLTFIDIDGTVVPPERNATIIRAQKPAPRPVPRPTPAPAAKPTPEAPPAAGDGFLVMDGGIESPVRTSSGHRTVSDDLEALFDAPLPPVPPAPAPKAPVAASAAPAPKAPDVPAAVVPPPAAKAQEARPVTQPPKPAVVPPAKVAASAAAPPVPTVPHKPASAPAVSGVTPAVAAVAAPLPASVHPAPSVAEDLDIPGGPLVEVARPEPTAPALAPARSHRALLAAGLAAVVMTGALLAWRPWQTGSTESELTAQAAPVALDSASAAGAAASAVPAPAGTEPAPAGPAIKPVAAIGPTSAPGASPAEDAPTEEIIAAVRPNFRADAVISTADIGIGATDRSPRSAPAAAPSDLARRAEAAGRTAQQELGVKLSAAGFRSVLAPSRIGSAEGAASARNAWIAGADGIRQYRARIGRIEKAYEDSMLISQRSQRWPVEELRAWGARQSLAEPGDVSQLADLMISQITEALDLLTALDGQYEIKNGTIHFRSPGAESRYTSIRNWVEQRTHTWSATPVAARPHSVSMILLALGDGLPPVR